MNVIHVLQFKYHNELAILFVLNDYILVYSVTKVQTFLQIMWSH